MSLESAYESLDQSLAELSEAVSALQITISEDKPTQGSTLLVDQFDNLVVDMLGMLEEADAHLPEFLWNIKSSKQLELARHELFEIHSLINRFTVKYFREVCAHDYIESLLEMGRERGREWREWSHEVKTSVERFAMPINKIIEALLDCWNELAQRMMHGTVSMQSTNKSATDNITGMPNWAGFKSLLID